MKRKNSISLAKIKDRTHEEKMRLKKENDRLLKEWLAKGNKIKQMETKWLYFPETMYIYKSSKNKNVQGDLELKDCFS